MPETGLLRHSVSEESEEGVQKSHMYLRVNEMSYESKGEGIARLPARLPNERRAAGRAVPGAATRGDVGPVQLGCCAGVMDGEGVGFRQR